MNRLDPNAAEISGHGRYPGYVYRVQSIMMCKWLHANRENVYMHENAQCVCMLRTTSELGLSETYSDVIKRD